MHIFHQLSGNYRKKSTAEQAVLVSILLLILAATAVFALNGTAGNNTTGGIISESQAQEDPCTGINCSPTETTCPDGFTATCSNTCDPETGSCSSCTPDCSGHQDPCEGVECGVSSEVCPDGYNATCKNTCINGTCTSCSPNCTGHQDPCLGVNCSPSTAVCPDGTEVSCSNTCINGSCTSCTPNCTGHQATDCQENWTCSNWSACINGTQTRTCEDLNQCGTNESKPTETQSCQAEEPSPPPIEASDLQTQISIPETITRGGNFHLTVTVDNAGTAPAESVSLKLVLPSGFSVSPASHSCGTLPAGGSCTAEFPITTDLSAHLGENQVEVKLTYG